VIAIVSSVARERAALTSLCENRQWIVASCDSVRAFRRLLARSTPQVVITRGKLLDGFGDDILSSVNAGMHAVVLIAAGTPSGIEARLVSLGADCVLRDPVRTDVLSEYLARYVAFASRHKPSHVATQKKLGLAGMVIDVVDRQLHGSTKIVQLTPREIALAQLLVEAEGEVVTYETLYREILGRSFLGDTSNMRVLLWRLGASAQKVGVKLRQWIDVIPKTGYRYRAGSRPALAS
jgi:DNA-binding response OmpR family regulator